MTNSRPATSSAGNRTSTTEGAWTSRLARSASPPRGRLPNASGGRPNLSESDPFVFLLRRLRGKRSGIDPPQERAAGGGELIVEEGVGPGRARRRSGEQQGLELRREPRPFLRPGLVTPPIQERSGGDADELGRALAAHRLVVEMPDVAMAERIRMGVAGEEVAGDVGRQVPDPMVPALLADRQVHRGEVARSGRHGARSAARRSRPDAPRASRPVRSWRPGRDRSPRPSACGARRPGAIPGPR